MTKILVASLCFLKVIMKLKSGQAVEEVDV